jgi:hypothetical protein
LEIYEMLKKTGLNFELVIVGPYKPDFELPKELRFYQSTLKPMQCFHAAVTMCTGQTLLQLVDDVTYQDGGIVKMYEEVIGKDNIMATCEYYIGNSNHASDQTISVYNPNDLPLLPVCGLYRREAYEKMGGLDRRFMGVMGELDLYMRMRVNGYKTVFVKFFCKEDKQYQTKDNTSAFSRYGADRSVFVKLWTWSGGTPMNKENLGTVRQDIVRSYENKDLLTIEQNYP